MALLTGDKHFDQMDQHISDIKDWLEMVVGRFQTRSGRKLEDVAVDGVIVTMAPLNEVETRCIEWGIKLVH